MVSSPHHVVAVASGKGGVGKSTTAVNLAYSLASRGLKVGIVDLDIHGPSLPTMVTPEGRLELSGEVLLPLNAHGVHMRESGQRYQETARKCLKMGLIITRCSGGIDLTTGTCNAMMRINQTPMKV